MYINWDERYSVGVDLFDQQHQRLFKMINGLHDGLREKRGREALKAALDGLMDYTKTHFADEERLMEKAHYPSLKLHTQQHAGLVEKVNEFYNAYHAGEAVMTVELIGFLMDWLKEHIMEADKQYAPWLRDRP